MRYGPGWVGGLIVSVLIVLLMLSIGMVTSSKADHCATALELQQEQYDKLEELLPIASEAVRAASVQSVPRLQVASARMSDVAQELESREAELNKAVKQCQE